MIVNRNDFKKIFIVSIAFCLALINPVFAGTVVVKPGQFDHFTLQIPDRIIAGENFIIKLQAYDTNNNLITNFSETGKEFRADTNGSATIQPSSLNAASFIGGTTNISINSKKAEKIIFSIRETGGTVPVIAREITILPNKLDHFILQAPDTVIAGVNFDIRIIAKDLFDNIVDDLDIGRNIKINSTGTSSIKMLGSSTIDFKNGMSTVGFVSEKAGDIIIELQEISLGSRGRTKNINISPSALSYFKLHAPKNVVAGEPFDLIIAAYDSYDNLVTNYSSVGSGIKLATSGTSKVEPSFVNPSEFKNGQTVVKAFYEKTEEIQIIAKENNKEQTGSTSEVIILNSFPDHFVAVTPDTAISGQRFIIRVEAYDRFNNIVKNFNLVGNDVVLSTTGTGIIAPSVISSSEFTNGIAIIEVIYDKAESFLISAKMSDNKVQGRITLKEQEQKKEVPSIKTERKTPEEVLVSPKVNSETKTTKTQLIRKRKTKQKITAQNEPVEKESYVEKEGKPKKALKDTAKKSPEVKTAKKEEKPIQKTDEKAKKPSVKPVKKEDKKAEKTVELFKINNISIIEAENRTMLVMNITNPNGNLEYVDDIESRYGKEWLKLKIKPAVRKTEKSFKFKSAFVGEVFLEEDKDNQNVLNVYVELLPSEVTYDIARVKNNLVITLSNP